jgi:hypothetical protein
VDFALVTKESATVGESLEFLAAFTIALVRTIMLVHVFAVTTVSIIRMFNRGIERTHLHSHFRSKNSPKHSWCLQVILPSGFLGGSSARL